MIDPVFAAAIAVFLALLIVAILLTDGPVQRGRHERRRPHRDEFRQSEAEEVVVPVPKRVAIIVNPIKFPDQSDVVARLTAAARALEWDDPIFMETTAADPGTGQAREAVRAGVDLVCPLGGDGTIRAVAAGLAGTETPLGLLPGGTGNLLARNLHLPIDNLEHALAVACTGRNKPVDVGWVALDPVAEASDTDPAAPGDQERHIFLVMAGLGFDARIMADTTEAAKTKLGWTAYVATGMKNLRGPRIKVAMRIDGGPELNETTRTVLIGNCGRLTGGVNLMPQARVDDGHLDAVVISPKGLPGWADVLAQVLSHHDRHDRSHRLTRHTGARFELAVDSPEPIELDGDIIGSATRIVVTVAPLSLIVRVPTTT